MGPSSLLGVALSIAAWGQGIETHRPVVPSAGLAAENGPGAIWVNPANLAYDPDPHFGLFYAQGAEGGPRSIAGTFGTGGLALGVHNRTRVSGDDTVSDWSLDYATTVSIDRLALGLMLSWNIVQGGNNYVAYDAGLSYRPLPWLGMSIAGQNIGAPDPLGIARPRVAAGLALRPFGRTVIVGLDAARIGAGITDLDPIDQGIATVRVRPVQGLYVRGNVRAALVDDQVRFDGFGAGLEVYFGGSGVGAHVDVGSGGGVLPSAWLGTDEPGESLIRSGRKVPLLTVDRTPPYQPRTGLFASSQDSWLATLERLRRLETAPDTRGLLISFEGSSMSLARYRELRDRIVALEAADKPVTVYLDRSARNGEIYVASAARRVILHPAADVQFVGLAVELTHLRGLLDLVGVEPQFVKRAQYKTAPETFTHPEPSQANLEMQEALIGDLFDEMVGRVAEGRGVSPTVVRGWIDHGPMTSTEALDKGLVDALKYPDELEDELETLHEGSVTMLDLSDLPEPRSPWEDPKQIAVIYVEGTITSGKSTAGGLLSGRTSGAETVARNLRRARKDGQVRAVVLRVDSPGGSALASDVVWREVERLKKSGKPVVASMGGVAASGGYYVLAGADAVWAQPDTITGSIGVFSGKFSTSEIREALGVSTTTLSRGRHAAINSAYRPWDDIQRERMQHLVDATYERFKTRVADGRDMSAEDVEERARGRVWSGARAKELGLVDELGGLTEALADARERAGIPADAKVGIVEYSDRGSVLQGLTPAPVIRAVAPLVRAWRPEPVLPELEALVRPLQPLLVPLILEGELVWALDPWTLQIGSP